MRAGHGRKSWQKPQGCSAAQTSALALALVLASVSPRPVLGETLREALAAAYQYNPRLDAERARLRATDENVARAESAWQPQINASADFGTQDNSTTPSAVTNGQTNPWGYSISLRQTVFNGFRISNGINEAEATVRAGRETLRLVETNTLLEAVGAYMDVVAAQEILRIRENNVAVLNEDLQSAKTRRVVKEVTRTDVAQAQARLARAISTADLARSDLKTARALYERTVGHAPSKLVMPSMAMANLPKTIEEAWALAEKQNPSVGSALYREEAARYAVDKVRGELLPEFNIEASYGARENVNNAFDQQENAVLTGRVSVPIYDGGDIRARVRQAKQIQVSRLQEIEQARADAQANVTAAWAALMAQRAKLKSDQVQVEANRVALEGVREEQSVGQRTFLDVLNAEQEFLDLQIELVNARREVVVASYRLLGAMGQLSAEDLGLTSEIYDPAVHLEETRQNWFGINITHANGRSELYEASEDPDAYASQPPASAPPAPLPPVNMDVEVLPPVNLK